MGFNSYMFIRGMEHKEQTILLTKFKSTVRCRNVSCLGNPNDGESDHFRRGRMSLTVWSISLGTEVLRCIKTQDQDDEVTRMFYRLIPRGVDKEYYFVLSLQKYKTFMRGVFFSST